MEKHNSDPQDRLSKHHVDTGSLLLRETETFKLWMEMKQRLVESNARRLRFPKSLAAYHASLLLSPVSRTEQGVRF